MISQPVRESIGSFLKSDPAGSFFIPIYQKNYMWKPQDETARFINDAEGLLKKEHRHFLGLIIYRRLEDNGQIQYEIVDGQQRLTTVYLFLLCLYQEARREKNVELARQIMKDYLAGNNPMGLRFRPAVSVQDTYYKLVSQAMDILTWNERQGLFYQNYTYIAQSVRLLAERYGTENVLHVMDLFEIIAFPLDGEDDVQQIFESINLAGSCMTFADRVRDFVFMNHTEAEQNMLYRMYWQPFEAIFPDADSMLSFIRSYLAVKTGSMLDRNRVYEGFKDYWTRVNDSSGRKLSDMYGYALCYQMIYKGPADERRVEEALEDYRIAGYKEPAVLLMEIIHRFRGGECTAEETARMIRLVDTYMTRRAIGGTDNKNLTGWYPSVLRGLRPHFNKPEGELYSTLRDLLLTSSRSDFPHGMPSDRQIRNVIRTNNIYANTKITRVLLERLEKSSSTVRIDMSHLNIEHIMPLHATPYWRNASGCSNDGEYNLTANLLGNLTLADAGDNMEMGNESFETKKKVLAETGHIHLNADVLKEPVWNKKAILKRCDDMAEALLKIYPYPVRANDEEKKTEETPVQPVSNAPSAVYEDEPLHNGSLRYYFKGVTKAAVYRYNDGHGVVLMNGSIIRAYRGSRNRTIQQLYETYKKDGAIKEKEDGTAEVCRPILFADLSAAGSFILQRGGDNSGIWSRKKPVEKEEKPAEPVPVPEEPLAPVAEESEESYPAVKAEEKKEEPQPETAVQAEPAEAANEASAPVKEETEAQAETAPADPEKTEALSENEQPIEAETSETPAEAEPAEPVKETEAAAAEEKPKKKRTVRKKKAAEETAEEKPKKKRTVRKKAAAEEKKEESEETAPSEPAEEVPAEAVTEIDKGLTESEDMEGTEKKTEAQKAKKPARKTVKKAVKKDTAEEKKAKPAKRTASKKSAETKEKKTAASHKKTEEKKDTAEKKKPAVKKAAGTKTEKETAVKKTSGTRTKKKTAGTAAKTHEKKAAPHKAAAQKTLNKRRNNRPGLRMNPQSNRSRSARQPVNVVTFAGQNR